MKKYAKRNKGFTLIELMISVAIVGILAAVAIPAYQNNVIKAQVSEGMTLSDGAKTYMSDFYANNGTFDIPVGAFPSATGKYVSSVQVNKPGGGQITVIYGNNANSNIQGQNLIWTATPQDDGSIQWSCYSAAMSGATTSAALKNKYLPDVCKSNPINQ
jgi:type IV pilus assembly protein PilA